MKTLLKLLILSILFAGCSPDPDRHTLVVAIDRTQPDAQTYSGDHYLQYLGSSGLHDGIDLVLTTISDTRYNRHQSFSIEMGTTGFMSNEIVRSRERERLFQTFKDSVSSLNAKVFGRSRSVIFQTVIQELNHLSTADGERTVVLTTDLKEHSSFFSVYRSEDLRRLKTNPEAVRDEFEEAVNYSGSYHGIHLHILYEPSLVDAEVFANMVSLYRSLLEPRGVRITVGVEQHLNIIQ